ncbi:MAG: hypothetical protein AB1512_13515 [Thermodesulfobacteriota bacterium]
MKRQSHRRRERGPSPVVQFPTKYQPKPPEQEKPKFVIEHQIISSIRMILIAMLQSLGEKERLLSESDQFRFGTVPNGLKNSVFGLEIVGKCLSDFGQTTSMESCSSRLEPVGYASAMKIQLDLNERLDKAEARLKKLEKPTGMSPTSMRKRRSPQNHGSVKPQT